MKLNDLKIKSLSKSQCEIFADLTGEVVSFVCEGLNEKTDWVKENLTLGIKLDGKLIAGVILNDLNPSINVWLTIYSIDKRWCNKRILRAIFDTAFDFLNVRRLSVMIDEKNIKSQKLAKGLGFVKEGVLRAFAANGENRIIFSMLKQECQWRTK